MLSRCVNGNQRFACTAVWSAAWSFHGTFLWHMQHSTTNLKVFWNMSKANLQAKCILPSSLLALVIDIGLPAMQLVRVWKNSHQGWTCCYPNVFRHFCIWLLKHDFNSVHSSICMYINIYNIMSFLSASYPWLSSGCEVRSHVTRCWHRGGPTFAATPFCRWREVVLHDPLLLAQLAIPLALGWTLPADPGKWRGLIKVWRDFPME